MGSRTPASAYNTIGFTVQQHPGGKVLNILGMKQGDAGKIMHGKNQTPDE